MTEQQNRIPAGAPIWIDHLSGDFARQQEFYEALFGWTSEDQGEEYGHYRMIRAGECVGFGQPGEFGGHDLPLAPGTSVWFEVMSKDVAADADFYRAVCGWDLVPMGADGQGDDAGEGEGDEPAYATNGAGEAATAGLCDAAQWLPDDVPSHWRVYFRTADMAASVRALEEHGGRVVDGPMDSPFGVVATVLDPAGATFQLIETPEG